MKKWVSFGVVLCLLFFVSACNRWSPGNQTHDPFGPTHAVEITVLSSKGTYLIGETETFTASLKMSDGTTVPITDGTWSSEFPDVATVDNAGLVTAISEGYIYIACAYQGMTAYKAILVRGDYRGSWAGTYSKDACSCTEDFFAAGFCATQGGSGYPIEFHLEMAGDHLQGTIRLGSLSTTLADYPYLDMAAHLVGHVYSAPYNITIYIVPEWTDSGPRFPGISLEYTASGMKGSAWVSCTFSSLTKTGD